jgi:YHS domain-containing protein
VLRFLWYLIIGYAVYVLIRGLVRKKAAPPPKKGNEVETYRDPVCGVYVSEEDAVVGRMDGERIYFCSMECLEKYRRNLENTENKR